MSRLSLTLAAMLVTAVAALMPLPGQAGNGVDNPNWFNDPVQGPSPNTSHTVGNSNDDGRCATVRRGTEAAGLGPRTLGGDLVLVNFVVVTMHDPDTDAQVAFDSYNGDLEGDWSGSFDIPENLDPGTYPLRAECRGPSEARTAGFGSSTLGGPPPSSTVFEYAERSYRVVAESDAPEPVDADVTLTG